jgi:serine/threonine protein kinase
MLTIDEYRGLGLALREAQTAGDHAKARRIENQLASAPRAIRRIYLGEVPPRRPGDEAPLRSAFLQELLAQAGPIPICDDDFAKVDSSSGLRSGTQVSGAQLGGFRLLEQIGVGSLGSVWLAEHNVLCRRAVIKVLDSSFASRPDLVMRLFNEARTVAAISDPGIARIYDVGHHTDGRAYIAMEYLEGESLDQRLHRLGCLPLPDALRIVQQVASTLGVAHQHGIVHRAVKPENIFLVRDPKGIGGERAKILDFGIAKLTDAPGAKTYYGTVMETPAYLSPEQCRGAQHVDQRSDVYALGCMLFALVTGAPPFGRAAVGEAFMMHLFEPPPLLSSRAPRIPPEIDALVQRCLAKDPASRYHSGTELAAEIGWILGTPAAPRRFAARSSSGIPVEHVG